jgi:hypothetical protein
LARAMIRYSPELITWRADVRVTYCDGYSNMIVTELVAEQIKKSKAVA